jgi:quinol monooxygenase YgiN
MSEPIVFISNQRIKEGKHDEYTQAYRQVAELTEANKPGTVAHLAYVNEDGTEASIVHVFPDAESMELHMQGVDELAKKAFEFMEIVSFEIYGKPSDTVLEAMKKIVGSGVTLNIKPQPVGGYIRFKSG